MMAAVWKIITVMGDAHVSQSKAGPKPSLYGCARLRPYKIKVRTPLYVRDNIHVDLMAAAYATFAEELPSRGGVTRLNPSLYVESQSAFANRLAAEMSIRLGIPCPIVLLEKDFDEPMFRIDTDRADTAAFGWSEKAAWDMEAEFYRCR